MLKKTLFVLLSALILSGICFAQEESAKKQMEDTTPAVSQEEPAKKQMEETIPAAAQEESAKEQMEETTPAVAEEESAEKQMEETTSAVAKEQPALVLEEIHICTAVEDRWPSGVGTVFPDDLDKIYCFTKIGGAEGTTYVNHVWYFGNDEIARVKLPVKSISWRTWSSKKLSMGLGNGHVEIVSESGDILGKAGFEIQAAEKAEEVEKTEETGAAEKAEEVGETEMTGAAEKAEEVGETEKTGAAEEVSETPKE